MSARSILRGFAAQLVNVKSVARVMEILQEAIIAALCELRGMRVMDFVQVKKPPVSGNGQSAVATKEKQ